MSKKTKIENFFPGTTKTFTITIKKNGIAQDITSDTVTFRVKTNKTDSDASAVISKSADVTSSGLNGIAIFTLTPTDTNQVAQDYFCDIEWTLFNGEVYVIYDDKITIKERVSDA